MEGWDSGIEVWEKRYEPHLQTHTRAHGIRLHNSRRAMTGSGPDSRREPQERSWCESGGDVSRT